MRRVWVGLGVLVLCGSTLAGAAGAPQKPMTNEDVIALLQAGLPESVVIEKIKSSKTAFDTSTDALLALKKAGAGDLLMRVVINPAISKEELQPSRPAGNPFAQGGSGQPADCATPASGGPVPWLSGASPAMWYWNPESKQKIEINYERGTISRVGFAGFGASLLVLHPIKADLRISGKAEFQSCINPSDAPLVRFSLDPESNERNTSVGRTTPFNQVFSISEDDLIPFTFEKTPQGYYKITPKNVLPAGEYGFVPRATAGYFSNGDRIYAFGVD